ncbi:DUF1059 domain-containing protein [Marinoscillum sp.]|uniref:DUF1059 domain-containing protein n=1 Tax=Marinoscillum sp. TaxID=2024838 RepID=UPI003BABD697
MKAMTCKQLGGACDLAFRANSFSEIAQMSKEHGMEMYKKGDASHLKAMKDMQEIMKSPETMNDWMDAKQREFDALPDE